MPGRTPADPCRFAHDAAAHPRLCASANLDQCPGPGIQKTDIGVLSCIVALNVTVCESVSHFRHSKELPVQSK